MFKATRSIYRALKADSDLKVFTDEDDSRSFVWLQFGIKNGGTYRINFISTDDDNDVAVRIFGIVNASSDNIRPLLSVVNKLNCKYRYAKFSIDKDGDVNIEYDFPLSSTPEDCAREIVLRLANIIDEAYPELMRAIWS